MSGFIATMFVLPPPHAAHLSIPYPLKPQPLQPVFTFAQSHSHMDLGYILGVDTESGADREFWTKLPPSDQDVEPLDLEAQAPSKPRLTYKSPLQRIGEALRIPQTKSIASELSRSQSGRTGDKQPPLHVKPADDSSDEGEARDDQAAPSLIPAVPYISPGSGRALDNAIDPHVHNSQSMAAIKNISLPTSLHRNPRPRAPFKPQKGGRGTSSWQLKQYAEATLGSGSLRKAVKLPEGEDRDEWLAVNVVDFYNQINLLYGSITEFCSPQSCPEMKATDEFEYLWQDSETFKKPTKMSAPEYVEHLMAWIQSNIDNEAMFPSRIGVPFPKTFQALLRNMFKRLYRVYAHIYCHHYPVIIELGLEPHLNTSFKHYVLFVDEFQLHNGSRDFWGPLGDLVESMLASD